MRRPSDRAVFLTLTLTRWLPVGLVVGLFPLVALERGLDATQVMTAAAASGVMVVLLELPTSGFADAFGRRPVLLAAGALNVVVALAYVVADSVWAFAAAAALMGVYRALDSGPLEAWYVDRVHAADPGADPAPDLARQSAVTGAALGGGAVAAALLIAWAPLAGRSPLLGPLLAHAALTVVHLAAAALLLREAAPEGDRLARAAASVREAGAIVREGLGLLGRNRILAALVGVELFWSLGMIVGEQMMPLRLAEVLGSEAQAGAWNASAAAAAWGTFALGAATAGWLAPRIGTARTAILARLLHGAGAVAMGLMAGPASLMAAYLVTFAWHGLANPAHAALLHREATSRNRATVLSMNSMASFAAMAVGSVVLGQLAGALSVPAAMVAGGAWSLLGALLYLPALRRERAG